MSSQDMDWSPEYCLACDRQTDGSAYCSETCRLAEYERAASGSEASSPASNHGQSSWAGRNTHATSNNFYLPSAYDFSKPTRSQRAQTQPTQYARRGLTPSSSQSSLFSMQSHTSTSSSGSSTDQTLMSEEAKKELRAYNSSFDQSRYNRRHSRY